MTTEALGHPGQATKVFRAYVLGALVVVYTFNFIDRGLVGILAAPIAQEFNLRDWQLGLLGGPAFAVLYTALGIPIAWMAERTNRITIMSLGFAMWSAATAACGFAGSFAQLLLARVSVGIGEAACSPPSASVISDYFPSTKRATALGIFALGIPIGTMLAAFGGGWLVGHAHEAIVALGLSNFMGAGSLANWRATFVVLGAPGVLLAILFKLTVREPVRSDTNPAPSFGATLRMLSTKPSFWHAAFASALVAFVGYGTAQFLPLHFIRTYGLSLQQASFALGAIAGIATASGTFLGGFLSDLLAKKHPRVLCWLPAVGLIIAAPIYILSLIQRDFTIGFAIFFAGPIFHYLYLGPMYGLSQAVAEPRMRATAVAVMLLIVNLIGYGLGPLFVGAASDFFAANQLAGNGLTLSACTEIETAMKAHPDAHQAGAALCGSARAFGLRWAIGITVCVLFWSAAHFLLAGRTYLRDRVA